MRLIDQLHTHTLAWLQAAADLNGWWAGATGYDRNLTVL